MSELLMKAKKAKEAASKLVAKTTKEKNEALKAISAQLREESAYIMKENEKDLQYGHEKGYHDSLLDRLMLNEERIDAMADALLDLAELKDPVGEAVETIERPNGLFIEKVRVPLGVVGMIYEARPNVTVDASALCLKTGNAVLLRGSTSALHSNKAIVNVIHRALNKVGFPLEAVQLLEDTSRETAAKMFKLNEYLDVLIPRGGQKLIQTVVENATVPVLETGAGNCHVFIDETAKKEMAIDIVINAKTQRPSVCNAIETVLIHKNWANNHLRDFIESLQKLHVELRVDEEIYRQFPNLTLATEEDWKTEYLDYILAVKLVEDVEEAIAHINQYGSHHSEAIISETKEHVETFFQLVDSAALYHNASTRFTDGFEFGFGAEIGISTQKLHARGPMGLPALTSTKYVIRGNGQIRQ
ncbi:glutamate-5-semialdehyde dehydrogenase [Bacillus alveayuensis]|jgi:glutamate-5-semialdehyde dehydrogenase|uniref:Gamma-glutamyl phosphate reductase n=1 Tax=Aeribacillus alveayuensis TaxID=279215 RepID=A0ABT9VPX4_9BACI|nr:glutamate-5-semialdehyde dehydrogenase [Bacillus alveayuensis]MDQ0163045.1 glutamate-5-semialdehyde dehydrogenase [Bacillus alveayuensis]